jgi:segregation and condensation protein B
MEGLKAIIEALIFASELPLNIEKLADVLEGVEKKDIRDCLSRLVEEYQRETRGFCIVEVAGGYHFRTKNEWSSWIKRLKKGKPATITPAMMETLAVIAYRQPVLKAEIDKVRGVDTGGAIKRLLEKKLVRIVGRKDVPGKPIIYGTTQRFLEVFNLKDLAELPTLRELKELQE